MKRKTANILESILAALAMFGISVACFIPTGVFLAIYFLLNPQGFWQKFVVFGVGVYLFGFFQFIGLVLFVVFWVAIIQAWPKR